MTDGLSNSAAAELSTAYHELLGIPPAEQPPTHYRLLGLSPFENNATVIERAADRQVAHLRTFKTGNHVAASQKLLSEVVKASRVLLDESSRPQYDALLRQSQEAAGQVAPPASPRWSPHAPMSLAGPDPLALVTATRSATNRAQRNQPKHLTLWLGGGAIVAILVLAIGVVIWSTQRGNPAPAIAHDQPVPPVPAVQYLAVPAPTPPPPVAVVPQQSPPPAVKAATTNGQTDTDPSQNVVPAADVAVTSSPDGSGVMPPPVAEAPASPSGESVPQVGASSPPVPGVRPMDHTLVVWQPNQQKVLGFARSSFLLLSTVGGRFQGNGETFTASVNVQGNWTIEGTGIEAIHAGYTDLRSPLRQLFAAKVTEVEWVRDTPPIKLIDVEDGFACLSGVTGCFLDDQQQVRVSVQDGAWYLQGKTNVESAARASVYRYRKPGAFKAEIVEHEWRPGQPPVDLLHPSEGLCFLSGVGGGMHGSAEVNRCEINPNTGRWRFEPYSQQGSTVFHCMSLKFDPSLIELAATLPLPSGPDDLAADETGSTSLESTQLAVPTEEAETQAAKSFRQSHAAEITQAKTAVAKTALAKKWVAEGGGADSPTEQYVYWKEAALLYSGAGDAEGVTETVNLMGDVFAINRYTTAAKLLAVTNKEIATKPQSLRLAATAAALSYKAMQADEYTAALELGRRAAAAAKRSGNPTAIRVADQQARHFESLADGFAGTESARTMLQTDPTNSDANLTLGRFYCFLKSDWERGLPLLAAGSNPELKAQAAAELPAANISTVEMGDAWWKLGEATNEATEEARGMQERAVWHYEQVMRRPGLTRDEAESRVIQFWSANPAKFFQRERRLALSFPSGWEANAPLINFTKRPVEGRTTHWETHPLAGDRPSIISRTIWLPNKAPCVLMFETASSPDCDWVLRVLANDKAALPETLIQGSKWIPVRVDLAQFAGKKVKLEIINAAGGSDPWRGEFGHFDNIAIVPK